MARLGKEVMNLLKNATRARKSSSGKGKRKGKGSGTDKLKRAAREFLK
jgi:hypothetical protein